MLPEALLLILRYDRYYSFLKLPEYGPRRFRFRVSIQRGESSVKKHCLVRRIHAHSINVDLAHLRGIIAETESSRLDRIHVTEKIHVDTMQRLFHAETSCHGQGGFVGPEMLVLQ
jgi:hypothetical protein